MFRNLSSAQRELIREYAKTETNLNGEVDGIDTGQVVIVGVV